VFAVLALGALGAELRSGHTGTGNLVFVIASAGVVAAAFVALLVSVVRWPAEVGAAKARAEAATRRVAAMTGRGLATRGAATGEEEAGVDAGAPTDALGR